MCVPRPAVGGIAGGCMSEEVALRYFFVLFQFVPTPSPAPSGRGKGACYGGVAPLRGPFPKPRITPPYLALSIFVHCPPVPTKASLSEQAGAHIHPRMGGGMKSGQGIPLRAYPGPPPEGLPGCGHDLRSPEPPAGPYGGKGENEAFSLVAPPCDPVPTSSSVPKAKLLLEHEDAGRTGRRSTLKGKGDSGGGCKEGPRGETAGFPQQALACPARRAQGIITEGIEPSGKTLEGPPGCPRRFCFSFPPGGPGAQKRNKLGKTENPGQMREGRS